MTDSTLWWLLAGSAVVLELLSGTFYLLMLALGLAAAALAAHLGASMSMQLAIAAVLGGGAVAAWHVLRGKAAQVAADSPNRDVHLDIGTSVEVSAWDADGNAQVKYRGSQWSAVCNAGSQRSAGSYRIVDVRGNQLVLDKRPT